MNLKDPWDKRSVGLGVLKKWAGKRWSSERGVHGIEIVESLQVWIRAMSEIGP